MFKIEKKTALSALSGVAVGVINGMLGAGGGMLAVPVLSRLGLPKKKAHSNAVAVILPMAAVSATMYMFKGFVTLGEAAVFIPTGLLGAYMGTFFLKKIPVTLLKRVFGGLMVYAGVRLLMR